MSKKEKHSSGTRNSCGPRHFLDFKHIPAETLRALVDSAGRLKSERHHATHAQELRHKKLAMVFEKPSTRTRVSFEAAMLELGGHGIMLNSEQLQLGRGETVADTARVLSRYVDAIMLRCHQHTTLLELAEHATVPVINGLTDKSHPCQLMADILTCEERLGPIGGKVIAWVGDGNNVANSWIEAAARFKFSLRLACPEELTIANETVKWAREQGATIEQMTDPDKAVTGADAVVTDTWISMGDTASETRRRLLGPYQIHAERMARANEKAIFLHCLPAHRGEEVTDEVIDGPQSAVWDEAENRLHVQKAILLWSMGKLEC